MPQAFMVHHGSTNIQHLKEDSEAARAFLYVFDITEPLILDIALEIAKDNPPAYNRTVSRRV